MYKFIIFLLFVFLIIFSSLINKKIFKSIYNYLTVLIILYSIVIFLSFFNFFGFPNVSFKTYIYLFIGLLSLELSSICILLFMNKHDRDEKKSKYKINDFKLLFCSLICMILIIPTAIKGYQIFSVSGLNALRWAWQGNYYPQTTRMFIVYVISPIISTLTFFSIYHFINDRKAVLSLLINIFSYFLIMLITGGRMMIFTLVVFIFSTLIIKYKGNVITILKKNKIIIAVLIAFLISIILVSSQRSLSKNEGLLFNSYSYFVGSVHLFDFYTTNPYLSLLDGSHLLYGKAMLSPYVDIFKLFISFVGIPNNITSGIEDINLIAQHYFTLSNGVTMNNNLTFAYVCLRDFGLLGLLIDPVYISLIYAFIYKKYKKNEDDKYKIMYFYSLSILPFFIFEYYFSRTPVVLTYIYIIIVFHFIYEKKGKHRRRFNE